ncbi:polyribonucleotide nucleotidyltransferase [Staphylococcus aureus]|nr:polyribonucleotide nucleotidyltransferase [Staphylococcus aureus]MBV7283775.1 polyribonucleotide nucleotidyltransferase [Staphylococcus aureus]
MSIAIIAVGSELLLGQIANTNGQFLSKVFNEIGQNVLEHKVIGDNKKRLESSVRHALEKYDTVILTGGLGPTKDDLTKHTVAQIVGKDLVIDEPSLKYIESYFEEQGQEMTPNNKQQALVIEGSTVLANHHGMAPGMMVNFENKQIILLPGPPKEMQPMVKNELLSHFINHNRIIHSELLRFAGIGESKVETILIDLIDKQTNPTIAPLAGSHEVYIRLTANADSKEQAQSLIQPVKQEFIPAERDEALVERVKSLTEEKGLKETVLTFDKQQRDENLDNLKEEIVNEFIDEEDPENELLIKEVYAILNELVKEEVRRLIADEKIRPDGRKPDEIRPLDSEVGILPRTHGSGLFTRGQTQALSVLTLGALGDYQLIDGLGPEEEKRFMHHYNFPNFSVGETGPVRAPGRREIGHGALGERALKYIIPDTADFPYTIRIVSEVLESNGSSSQASICGSTLALMDAGVPIKAPVAGIAMGLVTREDSYTILTDIQGMEDALGDMDFKVAGTKEGITAIQMDIKIDGLTREIIEEALEQARRGRLEIMNHMLQTIDQPRTELSAYAPKVVTMTIKPDKIRDVIGPGGKKINEIIDETGVKLDIEQDGTIFIGAVDQAMINRAREIIEEITREAEVGQTYQATVKRIEKYGAFVGLFPGKDALLHISQISKNRIEKVEDVLKIGDTIEVKITEIDKQGRVNASHRALEE